MGIKQRVAGTYFIASGLVGISARDKALLLKINTSIETVRKLKGELVGAWGLGCGGMCSRPIEDLGTVAAQPR